MRNNSVNDNSDVTKIVANGSYNNDVKPFNVYQDNGDLNHKTHANGKLATVALNKNNSNNKVAPDNGNKQTSNYEKLLHALHSEPRLQWQLALGKRIGFYSMRGELGSGNFSKVKIAAHSLTKGS